MLTNLSSMLRSNSPLADRLRGKDVFTRRPVVNPENTIEGEIKTLKDRGVPLRKVMTGLEKIGQVDAMDMAKKIYYGLTEPLTKVDIKGGQPGFKQQSPDLVQKGQSLLDTAKTEVPKATMETLALPGMLAEESARGSGIPGVVQAAPLIGLGADIIAPGPGELKSGAKVFKGFSDLTTKVLERLKGKSVTSKQEILDFTNMPELKQAERDLIRNVVNDFDKDVPVQEFANKVKTELLPLKVTRDKLKGASLMTQQGRYENIALLQELRGTIANYSERIYESPIKTSAGDIHFRASDNPNYFAHTRIEDLPYVKGGWTKAELDDLSPRQVALLKQESGVKEPTRRVIELQSDLFQKGRLEESIEGRGQMTLKAEDFLKEKNGKLTNADDKATYQRLLQGERELSKLEPYRNTWHERVIREEVKQAAKDGKTKLQFPTGETAMKIEGLGENIQWKDNAGELLKPETIKVGDDIFQQGDPWLVTEVLGDGKFKAINTTNFPEAVYAVRPDDFAKPARGSDDMVSFKAAKNDVKNYSEEFDISGKVDTNNPIYRFYEKEVRKYLTNKFGAKEITDPQGVKWMELDIPKSAGKDPVLAYGFSTPKTILGVTTGLGIGAGILMLEGKLKRDGYVANKKNAEKITVDDIMNAKHELEIGKMYSDIQLLDDDKTKSDFFKLLEIRYRQLQKENGN